MDEIKISSNRSFGIVFFIVFLLIGTYPLLHDDNVRIWSLIISIVFLILGLLNSKILFPLNKFLSNINFLHAVIFFLIRKYKYN